MSISPAAGGTTTGLIRIVGGAALLAATLAACSGASFSTPGPAGGSEGAAGQSGEVSVADGVLDEPVSVTADLPALTGLDDDLLAAVQHAADDAADDGMQMLITSGWRSAAYQEHLQTEAVEEYGSAEEAARWVASPTESRHVSGAAVDVGPTDAAYWMSEFGSRYGLCQTYANEVWHYELATEPGGECPVPVTDAAS